MVRAQRGRRIRMPGKGFVMERVDFSMASLRDAAAIARRHGIRSALSRFRRDEDGSLLIFGLFCLIMMMITAGISLDLMRNEERRTNTQATADRAALAAADLSQTLPPKDVVKDYFLKAGLPVPADEDIIVEQGAFNEWRTVQVNITDTTPTWFMNMVGVPTLPANATSTAEERIGQVEISLVLDISGSMDGASDGSTKIALLKTAAKDFIDTMFDSVQEGKLSMNIVTFSTQVTVGNNLSRFFNLTAEHTKSDCFEFDAADFKKTSMDFGFGITDRVYQRNGHFDPFNRVTSLNESSFLRNCVPGSFREILPFSGDRSKLKAYMDGLFADGNTSIDLGMKWGAALLDPSMQPVVDTMIAEGKVPSEFADRPYAYGNREALKVIVVMTDGSNTTNYELKKPYDSGVSRLTRNSSYSNTDVKQYSLWDPDRNQYWIFAKNKWRDEPWGDGQEWTCDRYGRNCKWVQDPGDSIPMTWQDVWDRISISWYSTYIIKPVYGSTEASKWSTSATTSIVTTSIYSTKDDQTQDICTAAKNQKVTIYSIGFEAPTAGQRVMRACASSPANYYDAKGLSINDAFAAIASSINKLRLTN